MANLKSEMSVQWKEFLKTSWIVLSLKTASIYYLLGSVRSNFIPAIPIFSFAYLCTNLKKVISKNEERGFGITLKYGWCGVETTAVPQNLPSVNEERKDFL